MKRKVLSLAPLPAEIVEAFIRMSPDVPEFEVIYGHEMSGPELIEAVRDVDIVFGDYTFKQPVSAELVAAARSLVFVQQPSVGYQHIDVEACTRAGVRVATTAGANTVSVAEHTIAWALCLMKNLFFAHRAVKEGRWPQMEVRPVELWQKVWGIVGLGRIGRAVAERLKPFGLSRILYYDIQRAPEEVEEALEVEFTSLRGLLEASDVVSLHAPLTDATRCMINAETLALMKPSAYLINVARGELVDEAALAEALKSGRIAGAGIDVFVEEPVRPENPLLAVGSDKLLLAPHVAGVTDEAARRIISMATSNVARVLKGEEPLSVINTPGAPAARG
jgi:phosphoglycerate dehydrogenase-like enzyme